MPESPVPALILASGSPYRADLLRRLELAFEQVPADIDEHQFDDLPPPERVAELATAKAMRVLGDRPNGVVIGSDQLAVLGERVLGKPGDATTARRQLLDCSGREVTFLTAVAVLRGQSAAGPAHVDVTRVTFRPLDRREIERYVAAERPLDCAGAFKAEGLGIALFDAIESSDPTALVGLPLIATARALRSVGYPLP